MNVSDYKHSPCQGCDDRCIGCHTTCGDYAIYKQELEKVRQLQIAESQSIEFTKALKAKIAKKAGKK